MTDLFTDILPRTAGRTVYHQCPLVRLWGHHASFLSSTYQLYGFLFISCVLYLSLFFLLFWALCSLSLALLSASPLARISIGPVAQCPLLLEVSVLAVFICYAFDCR